MKQNYNELVFVLLRLAAEIAARETHAAEASSDHGISTPFSTTTQTDWAEGVRLWNENGRQLIGGLTKRNCPACGQDDARSLFQSYDGYPFVECIPCGCWYVPLKVEAELFERFFELCPQAFAVVQRNLRGRQTEESKQSNLKRIGGYLDNLAPMLESTDPIRYLDMGCGLGLSLHAARTRGLQATGVESSRECIALAAQDGLAVFHISDKGLQNRPFHLISFWESIEHMVDPAAVLKECLKNLAPNGLLAFTVPNQNSPLVRTQREDCSFINGGYDTPGHINLFNPATIERLLERSGYKLLALDGQYGINFGELVSYMLGKHQGAYEMLQGHVIRSDLSEETIALLGAIGPTFALLERVTLISPILFGFACRKDDADYFTKATVCYHTSRCKQLLAQINRMEPASTIAAVLEKELHVAIERIENLEDQLRLAHNPLQRLARFVRSKLKLPKG